MRLLRLPAGVLTAWRGVTAFDWVEGLGFERQHAMEAAADAARQLTELRPSMTGIAIELTRREAQIASLAGRGLSNQELAEAGLSVRTVETYAYRAMQKRGGRPPASFDQPLRTPLSKSKSRRSRAFVVLVDADLNQPGQLVALGADPARSRRGCLPRRRTRSCCWRFEGSGAG